MSYFRSDNGIKSIFGEKAFRKLVGILDPCCGGIDEVDGNPDKFLNQQGEWVEGGGGSQDLQQITDEGNTTTNNINLYNSAIVLDNGSLLQKGFINNGADGGIARICSIGYQDEWENGVQYFVSQNSNQIVRANSINTTVPNVNFDVTKGYVPGSIFHDMNNQNKYICTNNTTGAAVWDLYYDAVKTDGVTITGDGTFGNPLVATGGGNYTYEIGQYVVSQGGVIFHRYIDNGVQYYLVVDTTNLSTNSAWSNVTSTLIGSTAQSTWDGLSNSNAIVGQAGFTSGAAKLCLDSTNNSKSDWYLPAIDELNLLFNNRFNVNKTLSGNSSFGSISGATQILANSYWSSTESVSVQAWYFLFSNGNTSSFGGKNDPYYVRAVRKFSI